MPEKDDGSDTNTDNDEAILTGKQRSRRLKMTSDAFLRARREEASPQTRCGTGHLRAWTPARGRSDARHLGGRRCCRLNGLVKAIKEIQSKG
ncbi:hypothetical protein E2C01_032180 [Portunus trituberculatus]|uniref:Uncharacterized protein n=1 Tax=Portunus trituberculatus TaxID=210409 RepID=A0A5B7F085_PORTR|nr:hypothetical protein [Portunus trituberculatus]